jgi:hypothetical protein
MTIVVRLITCVYSVLVCLYPRSFQGEFGEEMEAVFAKAVAEAAERGARALVAVCLRELRDWPVSSVREWIGERQSGPRSKEVPGMADSVKRLGEGNGAEVLPGEGDGRDTWAAVLAGEVVFLVAGLNLILGEIPHDWAVPTWLPHFGRTLFLISLILPAIGFGIGWIKGFPRWSYPYVGLELLTSLYMMSVATPGLRIFNYTFGRNDLWGWRAWIPFLVVAAIALSVTRSLRPLVNLFINAWRDWTLVTFGMFGFMPLLVGVGFDEMDRLYSLPFMFILTLVMAGTVAAYLRSGRPLPQVLALSVGITLIVAVTAIAPTLYWLEHGYVSVKGMIVTAALVMAVMFSPALLGLLRRSTKLQSTG